MTTSTQIKTNIKDIIDLAINRNASDIHFQTGEKPIIRINGKLYIVEDVEITKADELEAEIKNIINEKQLEYFMENGNVDFAFGYSDDYRLRGNYFRQQNGCSLSMRIIKNNILGFEQLNLPPIFKEISENYRQGFFLIVGPTGQGKTTSLAAILNQINKSREEHIITIEDPIEYIIKNDKSLIDQREVGTHTSSFQNALRACMRQDPDIIIIGEMRDYETMQAALTLAETGHLVLSTMHTNNSVQTIDRIIDTFPEQKHKQVRIQLASTLTGVISQRLVPGVEDELVFAYEQLIINDAIRNIIRTEKTEQIYNARQPGDESRMVRLEQCLAKLTQEGKISKQNALTYAMNRELIEMFMEH
jgi:twitching motility protein PilT